MASQMPALDRGSLLVTLCMAVGACAHGPARSVVVQPVPPGQYFPAGAFQSAPGGDESTQRWYVGQLRAMNEPPLPQLQADETYRFLWLRSFHDPVSVRIQASHGRATLVAVELERDDRGKVGSVKRRLERALTESEWRALTAALGDAEFWDAPTVDPDATLVADGAVWTFEGYRSGVYHAVTRWNPQWGAFRTLGEAFLHAAHLSFPADEVY